MDSTEDKEYLQTILKTPEWWKSEEKVLMVGRTLAQWSIFDDFDQVFDYFEKPWKWEKNIKFLINELL